MEKLNMMSKRHVGFYVSIIRPTRLGFTLPHGVWAQFSLGSNPRCLWTLWGPHVITRSFN